MKPIVIAALVLLITWNIIATFSVARSDAYDRGQKWLQVMFIWLVPLFGASLAWYFVREHRAALAPSTDLTDKHGFDDGCIRFDSAAGEIGVGGSGGDGGGH